MNKQLTDLEVNTILAKFMGGIPLDCNGNEWLYVELENVSTDGGHSCFSKYTESLDSLIPVWEKLCWNLKITSLAYYGCEFYFENGGRNLKHKEIHYSCSLSSQLAQAAAHATALAILELQSEVVK